MKKLLLTFLFLPLMVCGCQKQQVVTCANDNRPVVYFTQEISSQSLIKVYQQLGVTPTGTVAVKVSTGEPGGHVIEKATDLRMGSRDYQLVSIDGEEMLETLNKNHYSLVVRSHGEQTTYSKKGVRDLWDLQSTRVLQGAAVADKIIGTGAAFLMMNGGVKYITTNTISKDALSLLREAQIEVKYDTLVDTIENNVKTGECPLELKLKGVTTLEKAMPLIEEFVKQLPE